MKKCIFSLMVACLPFMAFQAAAQDNLTESQVRTIVNEAVKDPRQAIPASSLYGPRFEIVRDPDQTFRIFKFDKETGDTWAISTYKSTTSQKIGRQPGRQDDAHPGEINYQLIVESWYHIFLLNVHTGEMWESRLSSGRNAAFSDFEAVDAGL